MFELPEFRDPAWFQQALTHSSYTNEHPSAGEHNERLEFLGDSVLKYVLSKHLFNHPSRSREGIMTVLRSQVEQNATLARVALRLELGDLLHLGNGTAMQGGRQNPTILSGAFEAVIGAYHEDSGMEAVEAYILKMLPWMNA